MIWRTAPNPDSEARTGAHVWPLLARGGVLAGLGVLVLASACSSSDQGGGSGGAAGGAAGSGGSGAQAIVDLRADVNRNGTVDLDDPTEDQGEDTWDEKHGAIFLANIDDDQHKCPTKDAQGKDLSDIELAKCNDAADEVINGADDLLDLAPLKSVPYPDAPDDAVGHIELSAPAKDHVRLFAGDGSGKNYKVLATGDALPAASLRKGLDLRIEARDIVRDPAVWDGYVDVTLHVTAPAEQIDQSDVVRMRVAPVITSTNLDAPEQVYATNVPGDLDSTIFRQQLSQAAQQAGVSQPLVEVNPPDGDQWTQDYFETGSMSMPGPGDKPHIIRTFYRSANVFSPTKPDNPLRPAGRVVFTQFRGKDMAGIQQFDIKHDQSSDSLNSFGNLETIPPYDFGGKSYPLGRVFRGSVPSFAPDPTFEKMIDAQAMQPRVDIDTSWLLVGHVDETVSFVKANTPRGWALVINDPALAKKMLEDASAAGHGDAVMFQGEYWLDQNYNNVAADITIDQVLADTEVMSSSAEAATEIDSQLATLKKETGITDSEIIRVPFLHQKTQGYEVAYQPGTVNGIVLGDSDFGPPAPHGPVIDGKDIFADEMTQTFKAHGINVHFIEDWGLYHRLDGEVHCGSNALRTPPATNWWETGR
jgi:protein-arginine deiminase